MSLGNQIQKFRKSQNLSQEQLAEKIGVARQTISKWELNETAPDIKQAQLLTRVFNIGLDELLENVSKESVNAVQERKNKKRISLKSVIMISVAAVIVCAAVFSAFDIANRHQILYPKGAAQDVVINIKGTVIITNGHPGTAVFAEDNKPNIICDLPADFVADKDINGLYTDNDANYIRFNSDHSDNVVNPLAATDYYLYYDALGYHSYMDMARAAMYNVPSNVGVFSATKQLYSAGGARLIREQICAGKNADFYAVDGGLTKDGDLMRIYGFALCFDNSVWLITLKDYNDSYYFITVKDPDGIGKTIDTIGQFLNTLYIDEH